VNVPDRERRWSMCLFGWLIVWHIGLRQRRGVRSFIFNVVWDRAIAEVEN
jgi:hypothetical protein